MPLNVRTRTTSAAVLQGVHINLTPTQSSPPTFRGDQKINMGIQQPTATVMHTARDLATRPLRRTHRRSISVSMSFCSGRENGPGTRHQELRQMTGGPPTTHFNLIIPITILRRILLRPRILCHLLTYLHLAGTAAAAAARVCPSSAWRRLTMRTHLMTSSSHHSPPSLILQIVRTSRSMSLLPSPRRPAGVTWSPHSRGRPAKHSWSLRTAWKRSQRIWSHAQGRRLMTSPSVVKTYPMLN